jgi:hypothetical protein
MRIVIENLPSDVSEDEIREALSPFLQVGKIELIRQGSAPAAVIRTELKQSEQAYALAGRISGHYYKGRRLGAWVPLWSD